MMSFAEASTLEGAAWSGVVIAVLTAIGTAYNTYSARRSARDKMEFDRELLLAKEHHDMCLKQQAEAAEERKEVRKELAECREDRKRLWDTVSDMQQDLQRAIIGPHKP